MDPATALQLVLAAVLGGLIGIERQIRDKPAGLRTNMLICIGATQFMAISTKAAEAFGGDPMRIAAQIITGIGFLGAGAVIQSHGFVVGLTTAATIWVVAGVGMALGAGMYAAATLATALTLATLYLLSMIERRIRARRTLRYTVFVSDLNQGLFAVRRVLHDHGVAAANWSFRKERGDTIIWFNVVTSNDTNEKILTSLSHEELVRGVETLTPPAEVEGGGERDND